MSSSYIGFNSTLHLLWEGFWMVSQVFFKLEAIWDTKAWYQFHRRFHYHASAARNSYWLPLPLCPCRTLSACYLLGWIGSFLWNVGGWEVHVCSAVPNYSCLPVPVQQPDCSPCSWRLPLQSCSLAFPSLSSGHRKSRGADCRQLKRRG